MSMYGQNHSPALRTRVEIRDKIEELKWNAVEIHAFSPEEDRSGNFALAGLWIIAFLVLVPAMLMNILGQNAPWYTYPTGIVIMIPVWWTVFNLMLHLTWLPIRPFLLFLQ